MIYRTITTAILADLGQFPVVSILGPRQCGKTTLAKQLVIPQAKPTLYLDMEWSEDRQKLDDAGMYLSQHLDTCLIIDEVQLLPDLFPLLRSLIDKHRKPARFILLGSVSPDLLRISSESLAGRIAYHELTPFGIKEVGQNALNKHWLRGGFPEAFLADTDTQASRWMLQFVTTFVERDLVRLVGKEINTITMVRFVRMLAHLHGQMLNVSEVSNNLNISSATVNKYLDILESAFLIRRLEPHFINIGKRITKTPKFYFRDSGFVHALLRIKTFDELYTNPAYGTSWEGYVIEQIYRVAMKELDYTFYRTSAGSEVDLVLTTPQNERYCIEIKASNSPSISRGFYSCVTDLKPIGAYVITPSAERYALSTGVIVIGLEAFLEEVQQWL